MVKAKIEGLTPRGELPNARPGDDIVRTIASLARLLGMEVTVEGIETAEQAARMRELQVDYAQGFYFGRPVAPE